VVRIYDAGIILRIALPEMITGMNLRRAPDRPAPHHVLPTLIPAHNCVEEHLAVVFLWSLRRGFVSRLDCVLFDHVFALPCRAVKTRAFPVVNTYLGIDPHLSMASARGGWVGRFVGRPPCGHRACSPTRFPFSLRFLGSGFCFRRSRWRRGGRRRCNFLSR
jgi:hypothetical protein